MKLNEYIEHQRISAVDCLEELNEGKTDHSVLDHRKFSEEDKDKND